jgi:DHA1 family multidrug resistance protein-like MFS transporter
MQLSLKKRKKQTVPESQKFTSDFNSVIFIVIWNSLGFFFVEFIMNYVITLVLEASATELGLFFSFLTVGGLIVSFFVGYLSDHISKKKLVMFGSFGRGASYFGLYFSIFSKSLIGIYLSAFLLGVGAMIFWVPLDALISEKSSKYYRSSAFGKRRFAMGIGITGGAIMGLLTFALANIFAPENVFILYISIPLFGLANFYAGIRFSRTVDESNKFIYPEKLIQEEEIKSENIEKMDLNVPYLKLKNKKPLFFVFGLILLCFTLSLTATNTGIYRPFIQRYVLLNVENNPTFVAWIYLPTYVIGTLIAPKLGNLADKINHYLGITIASIFGGITTFFIINITNLWGFSILLIIDQTIMLTSGFVLVNILSRVSIKHRGKIFGTVTTIESFGMIIGPILGGLVWDSFGQVWPFIISIIVEWSLIPFFLFGIMFLKPSMVESIEDS